MTTVILFQRIIFPIIIAISYSLIVRCSAETLYMQKCYDADCSVQISKAKTVSRYASNHPSVLSFGTGETVNVYSKGAVDDYYWGVEIQGRRGLVPQQFLRESNVLHKNLSHVVPWPLKSPLPDQGNKNAKFKKGQEKVDFKEPKKTTETSQEKLSETPDIQASPIQSIIDGTTIPVDYFSTQNIDASITTTDMPLPGIKPIATINTESKNLVSDQLYNKEHDDKLLDQFQRDVNGANNDKGKLAGQGEGFIPPQTANGAHVPDVQVKNYANGNSFMSNTSETSHSEKMKQDEAKINAEKQPVIVVKKKEGVEDNKNIAPETLGSQISSENLSPSQETKIVASTNIFANVTNPIIEDNKNITAESVSSPDSSQDLSAPKELEIATTTDSFDNVTNPVIEENNNITPKPISSPDTLPNSSVTEEIKVEESISTPSYAMDSVIEDNKNVTIELADSTKSTQTLAATEGTKVVGGIDILDNVTKLNDNLEEKSSVETGSADVDESDQVRTETASASTVTVGLENTLPANKVPSQSVLKVEKADEAAKTMGSKVLQDNDNNVLHMKDADLKPEKETGSVTNLQNLNEELTIDNSTSNSVLNEGINNTVLPIEDSAPDISRIVDTADQKVIIDSDVTNQNILVNNGESAGNGNETTNLLKNEDENENLQNSNKLPQSSQEIYENTEHAKTPDISILFGNRNLLHVEEDVSKKSESKLDSVSNIIEDDHQSIKTPQTEITEEENETQLFVNSTVMESSAETIELAAEASTEVPIMKEEIEDNASENLSNDDKENEENGEPPKDIVTEDPIQSMDYTYEYTAQENIVSLTSAPDTCIADHGCNADYNQKMLNDEDSAVMTIKKVAQRGYWETLLYVGISALTTLVFSLGYYYIENMRRDSQLIARINKLEKDLLVSTKECTVLEETLKSTKHKLTSIEDESFGSNEMVLSLRADLDALQTVKAELEDQNTMLEKELESATEAGLELERMLREVLSSNNEVNPLAQSVEDLQARLNAQQAANESLTNNIALKTQENESLSTELTALKKTFQDLEAEVTRLTHDLTKQTNLKNSVEETLSDKIKRLEMQIKDIAAEKSALHKELKRKEMEAKDLIEVISQSNANNLDLEKLYEVSRIKAEAGQLREERDELRIRLNEVEGAHLLLEEHMKVVKEEVSALSDQCKAAEKEKKDAETRLEVLSNFFNEKEAQRQKEEAIWLQKQGEVMSTVERIHTMQNEIESYKQQIEILKREIVDQEREYKGQISALETKVHEQWVVARQTERRLEESKVEAGQLRKHLTLIEKNINDIDPEGKLHRLETNEDTTTSPALFMGGEPSSSPIMFSGSSNVPPPPPHSYMFGPPPLPPYLPLPLPSGTGVSPYDISQRPPPLGGRLSSPPPIPPPPLHPPPPPTSSSRYENTTSSPPPLSPQLLPPYDHHRSPPPPRPSSHGVYAPDHRGHPSFPPPPPPPGALMAPPPGTTHPWADETLPPLRNYGFHPNQQREQRPRNHKGSLHSSGESLDKSHHGGKV